MKKNEKNNLIIGFGASILLLLVSSTASYISISNLLGSSDQVSHTYEVIHEMERLRATLNEAESGQRGYLLTEDDEFHEHYEHTRQKILSSIDNVETLVSDNPEQKNSAAQLKGLVIERLSFLKGVVDEHTASGVVNRNALRQGKNIMDSVKDVVAVIEERELELLAARIEKQEAFSEFTPILIIVAALVAILITIVFYILISRDFAQRLRLQNELIQKDVDVSKRIEIIRDIADKVAQGDYAIRADSAQSDSLGDLSISLNKMASSLERSFGLLSVKEWQQTGLANLSDVMIGDVELQNLTERVIEFLSQYIGSHSSAMYILEKGTLKFSAGYAYVPDDSRREFRLGDGLIGQSVATGKIMELTDIPEHGIYIKYTAGEAHPKHVVALPIFDGRVVKGAIELASLTGFKKEDIEFLKACIYSIGIAISTAQSREQLQELLGQTQAQAEELQVQHSELENMNSELEVQAEKLQASEEELRVQQEELKQANQELEERSRLLEERNQIITERNIEIQMKAEELARSARYKSEFLANMSHELRTPLNSILLLSRLMAENNGSNLTPDQVEYARVIESSGKGLLLLIDEILDLSKIESGKMELDVHPISILEILNDMKALFAPVAQDRKVDFIASMAENLPKTFETDKMRLEQIIRNLLSNALKFTEKGYVSLEFRRDPAQENMLNIAVKDTGIGIPKDKQQLIFEAFQQADGSTQRKYGGTGLGLSISKELVKLLGGEIRISSALGEGSEFTVIIPLVKQSIKQLNEENNRSIKSGAGSAEPVVGELDFSDVKDSQRYISPTIPEGVADDRDDIGPQDKSILIIEDDVHFAKSLLAYTRQQNYKGIVAVRGDEGVELAQRFLPVGILLDIQLPIKSGWEVMEELKTNSHTRHIPVHIMSSHEVKKESLLKGAVNFIDKPVALDQMKDIFHKIEYVLTHHPKKVLIVEENAKHATALAYFLKTFDVKLDVKNEVDEAIAALTEDRVDCVVLDMGIPGQFSYDTLENIKKTPGLENLPIIVFTGKSLSRSEELRIKQYADSIVVKTAHSYKRILDEVSLFLHLMENKSIDTTIKNSSVKFHALGDVLNGKTVLIADDDMRNIFSLSKALESCKINVVTAIDGKDAIKQLKSHPEVDIVLMDMMMPEMDGYESTMAIRNDPEFKHLPIIAVTAKAMMGDREKCINAGASDYITKPVDIDQLLSLLRVWLYERR